MKTLMLDSELGANPRSAPSKLSGRLVERPSGAEIKARRKELGMTQQTLAEKAGIDVRVLSEYENDKRRPRSRNLRRLVGALGGMGKQSDPRSAREEGHAHSRGADPSARSALHDGLARLLGVRDATLLVVWTDEEGGLSAVAAGHENRLLSIRARPAMASIDELRSLRATLDRMVKQIQESPP